jgi:cytidylate kinase
VLPRDRGLTIRLVAPRQQRVKRLAIQQSLSEAEAERKLDELDDGRAEFVKRYFRRDVRDPHLYDLAINLEHMTSQSAAELIHIAVRQRFGESTRDR